MSPWLITTTSWPAATAALARALAGAAADPLTSTGAAMALLARRRGAPRAAQPGAPEPPIDFLRDEVVEICGALASGGTLLRRLGLGTEAERLEALFDAVEGRLAPCQSPAPSSASGS